MSDRQSLQQQQAFTHPATILRDNLYKWDQILRMPRGEDWPTMLGRLNAALNQAGNLDRSIEDVMEHFVYLPKRSTANAQDIPFFLSTRLADVPTASGANADAQDEDIFQNDDPVQTLARYENRAAQLVREYEENKVQF